MSHQRLQSPFAVDGYSGSREGIVARSRVQQLSMRRNCLTGFVPAKEWNRLNCHETLKLVIEKIMQEKSLPEKSLPSMF